MRKAMLCFTVALLVLCLLAGCGQPKEWSREGYFQDENENLLLIYKSEDPDNPGWGVTFIEDQEIRGWYIQQEGKTLHGNLNGDPDGEKYIVTLSEEGKDGVKLVVDGGDTYHFKEMELPEVKATVTINTEGWGSIAYAKGSDRPQIDEEYPYSSVVLNLPEEDTGTYTFLAEAHPGWVFTEWTRNGEFFSADECVTFELVDDGDYVAVFEYDENYVDPLSVLDGSYACDRAHADVTAFDGTAFVTIEWASSASENTVWTMGWEIDGETLEMDYEYGSMTDFVYDSSGEVTKEDRIYEDGTGKITFAPDGSSFTWHDDKSDRGDMVFERVPDEE